MIERVLESTAAGKDTFKHRGFQKAFRFARDYWVEDFEHQVLDLFARECPWGDFRNDINPVFKENDQTNMSMDAIDCLKSFGTATVEIILCDPPFSSRQAQEKYDIGCANLYTKPDYISAMNKEIYRVLTHRGLVIKAGYNSNAPDPRLQLVKMYISHYGASRNDVIFTIWKKCETTLID